MLAEAKDISWTAYLKCFTLMIGLVISRSVVVLLFFSFKERNRSPTGEIDFQATVA